MHLYAFTVTWGYSNGFDVNAFITTLFNYNLLCVHIQLKKKLLRMIWWPIETNLPVVVLFS